MPVHLFGNVAPMGELRELGLPVLEDAAQAAGATPGRAAARARSATPPRSRSSRRRTCPAWATAARWSPTTTTWRSCARRLRFHGSDDKQTFVEVGYNSRLDELQAAALRILLPELDGWNAARREAAAAYERLGLGEHVGLPRPVEGAEHVYHLYVVRSERADELAARADRARHRRARLLPRAGAPPAGHGALRRRRELPGTDEAARTGLALPMGTGLSEDAVREVVRGVRVWVDLTNSPHVLVMRPLIEAMREDGHEVEVTARDFAQTLELCERFGIAHTAVGRHRGGRLASKGAGAASAAATALARWARGRRFDVAMGHGVQRRDGGGGAAADPQRHGVRLRVGDRAAQRELPPGAGGGGAATRSRPSGWSATARAGKLRRYDGLKEEYYLADFEPDRAVLGELGLDAARADRGGAHPARGVALPPLREPAVPSGARAAAGRAQAVVLPRTPAQRRRSRRSAA